MPSILEAPSSMQEQSQHTHEALEVVRTLVPTAQRSLWSRLVAGFAAFRLQPQRMIVAAPQPEMQAIDCLARDYPFMYMRATCG